MPVLRWDGAETLGVRGVWAEADLDLLLGALKSSVGDGFVVGHIVDVQKPVQIQATMVSYEEERGPSDTELSRVSKALNFETGGPGERKVEREKKLEAEK